METWCPAKAVSAHVYLRKQSRWYNSSLAVARRVLRPSRVDEFNVRWSVVQLVVILE